MATKNKTVGKLPRYQTDRHVEALDEFADAPAVAPGTITILARNRRHCTLGLLGKPTRLTQSSHQDRTAAACCTDPFRLLVA
jgi:hypothetical protein